jgi:hypothetical protein
MKRNHSVKKKRSGVMRENRLEDVVVGSDVVALSEVRTQT